MSLQIPFQLAAALPLLPAIPFLPVALTDFQPRRTPQSYLSSSSVGSDSPVLCCYGDSLTHGRCGTSHCSLTCNQLDALIFV